MANGTPHPLLEVPPPIWALILLVFAFLFERTIPDARIAVFDSLPLAILFGIVGTGIAISAAGLFSSAGTELRPTSGSNKRLVTAGPFRFTRNPMYLGLVLLTLGIALYWGTLLFYAVPPLVFLICNFAFIPFEEAKMQRQFDSSYTDYRARVRRWI